MEHNVIELYTDGAFSSKTEMGGWGMVCVRNNHIICEASGYEPYSTNNRMELTGFLCALETVNKLLPTSADMVIYTDSAYVANCFNQGWYRKWMSNGWRTADRQDVKNQDILRNIVALYIKLQARISLTIEKVKGHSGNKWNEYCDKMAVQARQQLEDI